MSTSYTLSATSQNRLLFSFDVGHSSIGWAVHSQKTELLGCGVVTFSSDSCLASSRRAFRRQRRHIRATRLRIHRIEQLLRHIGALTEAELAAKHAPGGGHGAPWLLAARVIKGGKLLTWSELWDVLRWYAHNRGYDGNRVWSSTEQEALEENTEKVQNALALYQKYQTSTVAETFCSVSGLDPLGTKISCNLPGDKRPTNLNAAFPRENVAAEVQKVLQAHLGQLAGLNKDFITSLMTDWKCVPVPGIQLPSRYKGGLLFGQLIPRFDNRIIGICPVTFDRLYTASVATGTEPFKAKRDAEKFAKVPNKDCPEFLQFRWAMQVANVQVATGEARSTRALTCQERQKLDQEMKARGFFSKAEFKKSVRQITGATQDNLDQLLTHPDADLALVTNPALKAVATKEIWKSVFPLLPRPVQARILGRLRRGKSVVLSEVLDQGLTAEIEKALDSVLLSAKRQTKGKSRESLLAEPISINPLPGRAPYSRSVMKEIVQFVFNSGKHPAEESGPLFRSELMRNAQLQRSIAEQTNNHLVRHRLLILQRLHKDLVKEYGSNDLTRVARITVEVNRDLKELSGKTNKEIAQDLGLRLANFKSVSARLQKAFEGKGIRVTPGLVRKARIAEDLGWKCPYTGRAYDEFDLLYRKVDKDHIIPRSERLSDSLDSLVITFSEVNKMKGKRTALRFIEECGAQVVEGKPELSIKTRSNFEKDVLALESFKGHEDDKRRKRKRKELLLLRDFVGKEFTPGDLTKTSQLVRLAAQLLESQYLGLAKKPVITSLPGSVTGAVRKSWSLLGCLSGANPQVLDPETGEVLPKGDIRNITHLHHALDACVLGFISLFFPRDGGAWDLMARRRLALPERKILKERLGNAVEFSKDGQIQLADLPAPLKNQVRSRLMECRVAQHIASEMTGLRVEQNAWRVVGIKEGEVLLRQKMRQPDGSRAVKETKEKLGKVLGVAPEGGAGKLSRLKAALIIPENFGVALDPTPQIVPFHKVPLRLKELTKQNGGQPVRVLRNGMLIRIGKGKFGGIWRVFSVKNNASGLALDLGRPDVVRLKNRTEGHKINVLLASLLRDGLELLKPGLVGLAKEV